MTLVLINIVDPVDFDAFN